mmetsp:Transcript_25169/g.54240  ORF Transcript_25169/g.54240 Transcript_25169/m.54240 type:complete len:223 (-) Transcript_25169:1044-1712(-)
MLQRLMECTSQHHYLRLRPSLLHGDGDIYFSSCLDYQGDHQFCGSSPMDIGSSFCPCLRLRLEISSSFSMVMNSFIFQHFCFRLLWPLSGKAGEVSAHQGGGLQRIIVNSNGARGSIHIFQRILQRHHFVHPFIFITHSKLSTTHPNLSSIHHLIFLTHHPPFFILPLLPTPSSTPHHFITTGTSTKCPTPSAPNSPAETAASNAKKTNAAKKSSPTKPSLS